MNHDDRTAQEWDEIDELHRSWRERTWPTDEEVRDEGRDPDTGASTDDEGCRRCGRPVDFSPRETQAERNQRRVEELRASGTRSTLGQGLGPSEAIQ